MIRDVVHFGYRWLQHWSAGWWRQRLPAPELFPAPPPQRLGRLQRVVLTEEVGRTLFEDYALHRKGERGEEEIGWVLLGLREEDEVRVLATLPAGTTRSAGVAHVQFDADTQGLASRIVRQQVKRLHIVGVVHTHPGSLRHPSEGDYQGDSLWVHHLRGGEGVFGIGTADGAPSEGPAASQPLAHMQSLGELCFCWYALGKGERRYRKLAVQTEPGPDLARPLHAVWRTLEIHAQALDRLYRQQANVTLEALEVGPRPVLVMNLKLAEPGQSLRVVFDEHDVQYYVGKGEELTAINPGESQVDRALYLILAELAKAAALQSNI